MRRKSINENATFSRMLVMMLGVVFVQNDDKDVLQAASYDYIPQNILVVDDDQSTNPYGYEDDYHELLCEMGIWGRLRARGEVRRRGVKV